MTKTIDGLCRICGELKPLTFEHIPPRAALNGTQLTFVAMEDLLANRKYRKYRRGLGKHSLCKECNQSTAQWYIEAFIDWTKQGMIWSGNIVGDTRLVVPFNIKPLNVIKEVAVMALAASSEDTLNYHEELRRFVLNREQKTLPTKYQFHIYLNRDGQTRFESGKAILRLDLGAGAFVEAEIALPPFGYCITTPIKGMYSLAALQGLCEITQFAQYDYNVQTTIFLNVPARETHEPFPLDYRTRDEVRSH